MDIRKIALFLAGKLPPYYGNSNLYKFSKALKRLAPKEFTNDEMLFIQQQAKNIDEEVYFMVLDDLWTNAIDKREEGKISKQDIIEMLQKIGVPNEVLGAEKSIVNGNYLEELKKELENIETGKENGADKKFENWVGKFVEAIFKDSMVDFYLKEQVRTDDGLDIRDWILLNIPKKEKVISYSFWNDIVKNIYESEFIVIEAKNYSLETGQNIINSTNKYLEQPGIGRFSLLFTRKGLIHNGEEKILKLLRGSEGKKGILVLVLDENDYKKLIDLKIKGEFPEKYLMDKYFNLKTKI